MDVGGGGGGCGRRCMWGNMVVELVRRGDVGARRCRDVEMEGGGDWSGVGRWAGVERWVRG